MARSANEPTVAASRRAGPVAVLSSHVGFALELGRAGLDVLEAQDVEDVGALSHRAAIVVVDLVGNDARRAVVARLSAVLAADVPVVLVSADELDLVVLGGRNNVQVVVPPVQATDVARVCAACCPVRGAPHSRACRHRRHPHPRRPQR